MYVIVVVMVMVMIIVFIYNNQVEMMTPCSEEF